MTIRPSKKSDISQIIELLKASLGESLMPKSVAYWQWKHIDNPFGASPVWVAEEDGQLIGVRAFMKWSWTSQHKTYQAIRAVDTATDPAHQGKGIFKKLTLGLLEQCEKEGIDLVFNTPNSQSKPGYLKMGWQEVGKLPIQLSVKNPLKIIKSKLSSATTETSFLEIPQAAQFNLNEALASFQFDFTQTSETVTTTYTLAYLKWRYAEIPIIPYYAHYNKEACCIFRLKAGMLGTELRICEIFGELNAVNKLLKAISKSAISYDYMSIEGFSQARLPGLLKLRRPMGPDVTIRTLAEKDLKGFQGFSNWHPALGDLEVF